MWLLSLRDLQWRRRRFLIAIIATSLIFSLTLLMAGASGGIENEVPRIVDSFHADRWIVAEGATGPFTATRPMPQETADEIEELPGVEAATSLILFRGTIDDGSPEDVNLIGYPGGRFGAPALASGRQATDPGEVVADTALGLDVGDTVDLVGHPSEVVGTADDITFYFGLPTLYMPLEDLQELAFAGQPFVTTVITQGVPEDLPDGVTALTNEQVIEDFRRPTSNGASAMQFINALLWLAAVGIIGSIVFLTALERQGDFAVLKATGAPSRMMVVSLLVQALVLAFVSAVIAVPLAKLLAPGFEFEILLTGSDYVTLFVVAAVVGAIASLAGARRALTVDPALAFG